MWLIKANRIRLSAKHIQVIKGLLCPYCGAKSALVDSAEVYGRSYNCMMYWCRPCDAYVGCHKNSTESKGRLANKKLRTLKILAHQHFDKIWKKEKMTRTEAYQWLSKHLELPGEYTHIGMFNEKTCIEVIRASKKKFGEL